MMYAVSFVVGWVVGLLTFGGLWLTVRRVPGAAHPYRWLVLSGLGRLVGVLAAFGAVVAWGGALALLLCLSGLIAVRTVLILWLRPSPLHPQAPWR
jgi:F1F0 ATPase subunit 2